MIVVVVITEIMFRALKRLHERIGELHVETDNARTDLRALYKERTRLEKEREVEREEIDRWNERIKELQMLKFGRLVDLDELEQGTDKAKEDDAAEAIRKIEEKHLAETRILLRQKEEMKNKIADVSATCISLRIIF